MKAYSRIIKRGSKLDDDPPAEALHRLRIDAKKLRYLLEFFASLYPDTIISNMVKELKRLQDILGGFNDMEVQQRRLAELADQLMAAGGARSGTLFAMGRLAHVMAGRQEQYRHAFSERFASFASKDSQRLYRETFG
jgi:CHAD domain-containing protein